MEGPWGRCKSFFILVLQHTLSPKFLWLQRMRFLERLSVNRVYEILWQSSQDIVTLLFLSSLRHFYFAEESLMLVFVAIIDLSVRSWVYIELFLASSKNSLKFNSSETWIMLRIILVRNRDRFTTNGVEVIFCSLRIDRLYCNHSSIIFLIRCFH